MRRLVLILSLVLAAPAQAALYLAADTSLPGEIRLSVAGSPDHAAVTLGERIHGRDHPLATLAFGPYSDVAGLGPLGTTGLPEPLLWRCHRTSRAFYAKADGERKDFAVRTPSCRNRLTLTLPRHARPGRRVTAVVRDTWGVRRVRARLCTPTRCRRLTVAGTERTRVRLRRGYRAVTLTAIDQRVRQVVAVGVPVRARDTPGGPAVLATGDSMMQSVAAILGDRLGDRAHAIADVHLGSGLTAGRWPALARRQVADAHPHAVIVLLGVNDGYPLTTRGGE
ncbi:MAG: hypothetical protein QOI80_3230, partial [Solirubrobacteraceae bacterium]|nr:hypothetical protein [Solirubrobacteraceae bacterium]